MIAQTSTTANRPNLPTTRLDARSGVLQEFQQENAADDSTSTDNPINQGLFPKKKKNSHHISAKKVTLGQQAAPSKRTHEAAFERDTSRSEELDDGSS